MATRISTPQIGQPAIPQQQALEILAALLHDFEAFSDKPYAQAKPDEREWQATTESMVVRAFGENSIQHRNYQNARRVGKTSFAMVAFGHGPSDAQRAAESQQIFEKRTSSTRAAMKAMIRELQILAPKTGVLGVYDSGDPFSFYRDLTQLLRTAATRVFIVDAYFGREIFDLYLDAIPITVSIGILTAIRPPASSLSSGLLGVAKLFQTNRANFEVRVNSLLHDRVIFIDDRCWVIGQSIKDAAHKKPTYMIEIGISEMRAAYDSLWTNSSSVTL